MLKKSIIFFFFSALTTYCFAQQKIKSFDEDPERYPEVVAETYSTNITEEDKLLVAKFTGEWNVGAFTGNEKISIIKVSNAFLEKKARNIHYWMFWRCLLSFKKAENAGKGYDAWMKALDATCQDRRTTPTSLQTLMTATLNLLDKRLIFSSPGNDWKCSNHDYRFDFSNNVLSVIVGNCDLYCYSKGDSIMIGQTSGRFSMNDQMWKGKGGTVNWVRAGYAPDDVTANLGDYTINMKKMEYEADSVWLKHVTYFPAPVMGKLIDKVRNISNPATSLYPEFITYHKKFVFNNLYPNVDFEGGITIQGARTIGSGTDEQKATVRIHRDDTLRMDIESKSFVLYKDRINARNVSLVIHLDQDSVFHTNLSFAYLVEPRELNFIRSDAASAKAPYNNSYHQVTMDFEQLIWKVDDPLMSLSTTIGASGGRAQFRSQNFFDQRYFESLQYYDAVHPLISVRNCAANWGVPTFPSEVYARQIRRSISDARVQLIEIAKQGFIIFDGDKDQSTVLPQLYEFLSAAAQKTDFDVIDLRSSVVAPTKNAMLNVQSRDMFINGIDKFMVSDSQRVIIAPKNQQIVLKKNRNIVFDGHIDAGQTELTGYLLFFHYDKFKIDLTRVDTMYLYIPVSEPDQYGQYKQMRVKTAIENMSGSIQIDHPNNKSGRRSMKQYPIFKSDSASYVYYTNVAGGVYNRETFFFELDPFVLDSIDNLTKKSIALKGRFVSADIFDDMRQTLLVQPDHSLGFTHDSDSAVTTYKNSELFAEIRMSNRGLKASGRFEYLTANIHSDEMSLYPDSMNVFAAKKFTIRKQTEGTEFPEVHSEGNRIHWEPKKDRMYIFKKDKNFNMYNPETQFDGSFLLTSKGLLGKGRMDMGVADLRSNNIAFKSNTFSSDTSLFRLRDTKDGPVQFAAIDSLHSEIDFNTRKGRFVPAKGKDYTLVQFPANKWNAHIEGMIWDMDEAKLNIGAEVVGRAPKTPVDFKYKYPDERNGTRFYSTTRDADSLNFVATKSVYDVKENVLKAEGVNLVKTFDAIIYPGNGELTISPQGALENIKEAQVIFNDNLQQYKVYDADLRISGRRQYSGSGKYDYVDETEKKFVIDISSIGTDKTGKTIATGAIPAESEFMLSPYFRYYGNITLASAEPLPVFDGVTQIVHECENIRPDWFKFKSPINPEDVKIIVDDAPVNAKNNKIYNGIFLTNDSTHIYPAFFSARKNYSDHHLVQASGELVYDKDSMIYFIASKSKLKNRDTIGNLIAFDRDRCLLNGEGRLSLGTDLGRVKTDVVGRITHNINNRETEMDAMISFSFHFDDALAQMVAAKMEGMETLAGVNMQRPIYVRGMNEWLGMKKAETFRRDALLGKVNNFPAELNKTLVLTQLRLQWHRSSRSWRSTGKIGVGNLFGHQVNRLVDGVVVITKRTGGDEMDIYLKMDDSNWVYFGYTREVMQVISSDNAFNDRLKSLPEKVRKTEDKRPTYRYNLASDEKFNTFMRQYQQIETQRIQSPQPSVMPDSNRPVAPPPATPEKNKDDTPIIEVE